MKVIDRTNKDQGYKQNPYKQTTTKRPMTAMKARKFNPVPRTNSSMKWERNCSNHRMDLNGQVDKSRCCCHTGNGPAKPA